MIVLRGLIAARFLGRQRDDGLARCGLVWLGINPSDARYTRSSPKTFATEPGGRRGGASRPGEFLVRDHSGRIGKAKIMTQPYRSLSTAVLTTPIVTRGHRD
ncbi:hypothetical protein [Amycolatopsis sp. NPDC054798]